MPADMLDGAAMDARRGDGRRPASPMVSIVMANFNGAAFVEAALRSTLAQSLKDIEVLVSDDASTDDSAVRIAKIAASDSRVRLLRGHVNAGPSASRNRCLDVARGRWIAIMDSDDLMHPQRLERLLTIAEADGADIVADDLLVFHDDAGADPQTCLHGRSSQAPFWVNAADYVRANSPFGRARALGYLKPLIRTDRIAAMRYDTDLRIAEDYDFLLRLLVGGARFRIYPSLTYFYRKHTGSVSHRLSRETLAPMMQAHDRFASAFGGLDSSLDAALAQRRAGLQRAIDFDGLIAALKKRDWRDALARAWRQPSVAALLRIPVQDRLRRAVRHQPSEPDSGRRKVCLISRQRVVGRNRGSSTYLLSLCQALDRSGCDVHLLWPSPGTFGRWPAVVLRPEMALFRSIRVCGSIRLGPVLIATNPLIAARAALAVVGMVASRLGLPCKALLRPAPYAISAPWTRADCLFVARHARARADVIMADYVFLTEAIPYVLRPDAQSVVIMHDLFSSRSSLFDKFGAEDSVARLDAATEMTMLARADAVVAIQADEAADVRRWLSDHTVITAPMATTPVGEPQPGAPSAVLFVGTETAPNALGLRWFIAAVWPAIRAAMPDAELLVAGTVGRTVAMPPPGVRLLGSVADLAPLYREAAVVISPLQVGSGLKIKLVEALGHGKAVVATTVTVQGVDATVRSAVVVADEPAMFAAGVVRLLTDRTLRAAYGAAALAFARTHFSAEACYGEFLDFINRPTEPSPRPVRAHDPALSLA
jgi:GT2 family glycosyltransferase/glycosyltransferase involved in cell wall biosynthesis